MARRRDGRTAYVRQRLADEAARMMREQGIKDFLLAKRKAANRLGIRDRRALPGNDEIASAPGGTATTVRWGCLPATPGSPACNSAQRDDAVRRIRARRLVGSVLSGAITDNSDVNLHLFADTPESVAIRLMEHDIPYECGERRVRYPQRSIRPDAGL